MNIEEYTNIVLTYFLQKKEIIQTDLTEEEIKENIESIYLTKCAMYANLFFKYSDDAPGYLVGEVNSKTLFAPWHLADHLPTDSMLDTIVSISDAIKVYRENPICLSGSAAFLKSIPSISDLDFCEYFVQKTEYKNEFEQQIRNTTGLTPCALSYMGEDIKFLSGWDKSLGLAISTNLSDLVKIDVVYKDTEFEIAATNVLIPLITEEQIKNPNSWTFQEAVITGGQLPPRSLTELDHLHGYVDWLRKETTSLAESDPGKALKRAASLAAILSLDDYLDRATALLSSKSYQDLMAQKRRKEVTRFLAKAGFNSTDDAIFDPHGHETVALFDKMKVAALDTLERISGMEKEITDAYS